MRPETDDPDRLVDLARVFVGPDAARAAEREVESVRFQYPKGGRTVVLLGLADVTDREGADAQRGLGVYAHPDDLPALIEGEVFVHDLIGLRVETVASDGEGEPNVLGEVRDVLEGGAALLIVVSRDGQPDVLVPDVPEIVLSVDLDAGRILIDPPDGLLDL